MLRFAPVICRSGCFAILFAATSAVCAEVITTVPTGLNPGDQYRLVFVTAGFRDASSSDISVYNDFVTAAANSSAELLALGTTWRVIGSTTSVNALVNTGTVPSTAAGGTLGVPIYNLGDLLVASSNDDLWDGSLSNRINVTETGGMPEVGTGSEVFTGTVTAGTVSPLNSLGTTSSVNTLSGFAASTNRRWVNSVGISKTLNRRFYGMSGILTVSSSPAAVPEPGTFAFATVVTGIMGLVHRRRRRSLV